jgi:hypothetical protein
MRCLPVADPAVGDLHLLRFTVYTAWTVIGRAQAPVARQQA